MTAPPSFPITSSNVGWPVKRASTFSSRVASHVSGREVRVPLFSYPLYAYELTVEALDQYSVFSGLGSATYQALRGLYEAVQGQYGTFLYADPGDRAVTGQLEGTGDGATTSFQLVRSLGGTVAPVGWVTALNNVYLGGGVVSPDLYSLVTPNMLVFNTAPNANVQIEVDMTYAWVCRFLSDSQAFDEFTAGLHSLDSLKFRTVKP